MTTTVMDPVEAWPEATGFRERAALLVALCSYRQRNGEAPPVADYTYDHADDRWTLTGEAARGPIVVCVAGSAPIQMDRLRKLGITYHEALQRTGFEAVPDSGEP